MHAALWILAFLVVLWAAGPRPRRLRLGGRLPELPKDAAAAASWLDAKEAARPVRPDNQARVVWAGEPGRATDWCFVYLHGFSASWREGSPVHLNSARRYGANLLLPRLSGHGLVVEDPLIDLDARALWEDSKEALALAHALGKRVLLMATSSGAPLALHLAALFPEQVDALVFYSANIRIRQPGSRLMTWPWGLYVARLVKGGKYNSWSEGEEASRYWYGRQRLEGAVQLQALLDATTKARDLARVTQPLYAGVYYRDEKHRDPTIEVDGVRWMIHTVGTPAVHKRLQEFPDATNHVIACDLMNCDWRAVQAGTWAFLEEVVGLKALP
ncbi:MAG TPA: alpha/beta hydrolase [bacterium]|jgi:pimeloyl-ACP methyl ester carboxylesterase|nr:alpha/beta hydrolase [bacterium]